ncbi:hypothetical protein FNH22_00330 [Fulvivirga sp. M361]|uniref:maleylpyruvate isomerase N-terminal domain-containing protein n=1 Tax=Fulvivirga sp. M361 TaxID=2594266 RepID=UPI00117A7E42|nr:maleylpyruvate isomerase N-terminal domain-containing protein [Fulvivirga sp. M361]TRX62577.1 hypothetical protein FNH22_00330 [Fulvivirga sp. M361]
MHSPSDDLLEIVHKLPELDKKLIELLENLSPEDWSKPTVAKLWTVKDVAAHLLDGNIRILSSLRDKHQGEVVNIQSYQDLLDYLNQLNADWVKAMKRVSPDILILMLKITGPLFCEYYATLDPYDKAAYAVAWAGEEESKNWMHIAREYTEKFLHQQQIRDAVGLMGLMTDAYYRPFLDICMLALPYTFKDVDAKENDTVKVSVTGDAGGSWMVQFKKGQWELIRDPALSKYSAEVTLAPEDAWKLFSKSVRPDYILQNVTLDGNRAFSERVLQMVSFMA